MSIDPSAPILVTGATGYVAGWLVRRLLEEGFTVHAPVRRPDDPAKVGHLVAMAEELPGALRLFRADLLEPGSYGEAMEGCALVFHTASPFTSEITDPQKQLVEPAQLGTRNVLEEANAQPSVRRVVVTSSCAAIYGDNADLEGTPGGVFTEEVWNTSSSLDHQPYAFSKTLAEREAWAIAEAQDRWDLVVVNPAFVLGPGVRADATSESFSLMRQLGDGTFAMGMPAMGMGIVDVRDVAELHWRALTAPGMAGERFIACAGFTWLRDIATVLREELGDDARRVPTLQLPDWSVRLLARISPTVRAAASELGTARHQDSTHAREVLGWAPRPPREAILKSARDLMALGVVRG